MERSGAAIVLHNLIITVAIIFIDAASSWAGVWGHVSLIAVVDNIRESWVLLVHALQRLS